MKPNLEKTIGADYFGFVVEVICTMEYFSIISLHGEKFIVETEDLIEKETLECAA